MEDYQKLLQMIEDLKKTVTEQQIKIQELEEKVEEMYVEYGFIFLLFLQSNPLPE